MIFLLGRVLQVANFSLLELQISCHSLWAYSVSVDSLMGGGSPLIINTLFFSCCLQNPLFILTFAICIIMSWCGPIWVHLVGPLCFLYLDTCFIYIWKVLGHYFFKYISNPLFFSFSFRNPYYA